MADYTPVKGFWQANASESAPDLSTLSSQGFPTNGNPSKGTPATIPGAGWFYWVQQNIYAIKKAANLAASNPPTETELKDGIAALCVTQEELITALKELITENGGSVPA